MASAAIPFIFPSAPVGDESSDSSNAENAEGSPRELPGTAHAQDPFWSPDNQTK